MWQPQVEALFDIRVVDADAPSYRQHTPAAVLDSGVVEKKRVYRLAVEDRRGIFVQSVIIMAYCSVKPLTGLASKWEQLFSEVLTYVRSRHIFASIRSASLCLWRSKVKWRSGLGFEDGTPLQFVMQ